MTISRTAAKRDGNEPAIIRVARALGAVVLQQSGEGLPDLLVGIAGKMYLVEVKMPGEPLKPAQEKTFAALRAVGVPVFIAEEPSDMRALLDGALMPWRPDSRPVEGKRKRAHRPGVDKARTIGEICEAAGCATSRREGRAFCAKHRP